MTINPSKFLSHSFVFVISLILALNACLFCSIFWMHVRLIGCMFLCGFSLSIIGFSFEKTIQFEEEEKKYGFSVLLFIFLSFQFILLTHLFQCFFFPLFFLKSRILFLVLLHCRYHFSDPYICKRGVPLQLQSLIMFMSSTFLGLVI